MPRGKGTYGSKVGRPPKKKTAAMKRSTMKGGAMAKKKMAKGKMVRKKR